ncbi:TPA: hypothetical protein ACJGPK_004784 [Salmonella enterica subsp. enterica serovar Weltevreden]|uniref:Uncharacterized protein n=18 Tax=Enterobacterales TaxID=91347 RepID=A0A6X7BRG4_SALEN|nr:MULTISPECIES: hypothetical protein [Enterobacteriaceae]EAA2662498.1 hypothetical protein [Salmonella enterica subsp. enterica serovar Hadar]EAM7811109.1 hypothetical protein [Salmonella enterica]EBH8281219.1 hypothetical protein [Salmonella enterica subsp. enterica serovar Typhimurium str. UK-1]ECM3578047.1 hypothetical protein [Salmonella enterica subsp. enterica serovar Senftenberg]ECT6441265.1 hypothetical protein [Salmonella enterica subsp. enterica]EDG9905214.1 hypothetical protein [S
MKKQILALALLSLPLIGMAKDSGYGNTEWGMTPNQVVAAQKGKAHLIPPQKYKDQWGKVSIEDVNIGSGIYTVTFIFDASDKLVQTNVASKEKKNEGIANDQFNLLNQLLTQKYGKPQFVSDEKATWKTDTTTIELNKMIISGIMAQTLVRYIPNKTVISDTSNL